MCVYIWSQLIYIRIYIWNFMVTTPLFRVAACCFRHIYFAITRRLHHCISSPSISCIVRNQTVLAQLFINSIHDHPIPITTAPNGSHSSSICRFVVAVISPFFMLLVLLHSPFIFWSHFICTFRFERICRVCFLFGCFALTEFVQRTTRLANHVTKRAHLVERSGSPSHVPLLQFLFKLNCHFNCS